MAILETTVMRDQTSHPSPKSPPLDLGPSHPVQDRLAPALTRVKLVETVCQLFAYDATVNCSMLYQY